MVLAVASGAAAADGDLDPTFGAGGVVLGAPDGTVALAAQADDRLVLAIRTLDVVVVRYTVDGAPDPTWGAGGGTTIPVAFGQAGVAVARASTGGVLVGWAAESTDVFVARLDSGGVLDGSFGVGGVATLPLGASAGIGALAETAGGQVVVAAHTTSPDAAVVARLDAAGALDGTFGTAGVVSFAADVPLHAIAIQPDGRILVGGGSPGAEPTLARLLDDGTPDAGFGDGGTVDWTGGPFRIHSLALQPGGRIVAGGSSIDVTIQPTVPGTMVAASFLPDGTLDGTFDGDGVAEPHFFGGDELSSVERVLLQTDGRIVLAGSTSPPLFDGFDPDVALARLLPDGTLDGSFGTGGLVRTGLGGVESGDDAVLQADGRVVVAGLADGDHLLARYVASAEPFCGNGIVESGEACDGGPAGDGCCTSACALAPAGTTCDDGDVCTTAGSCEDGVCIDGGGPVAGCRTSVPPAKGLLLVRDHAKPSRDRLTWKWRRGAATTSDELAEQDYTLCVWDGSSGAEPAARLSTAGLPCDGSCFRSTPSGRVYANDAPFANGLLKIVLGSGADGRARVKVSAKGDAVPDVPLPLAVPVLAQLHGENGVCLEATYGSPVRNDDAFFKSPPQ